MGFVRVVLLAALVGGCTSLLPVASSAPADALRSIRSADASGPFGEAGVEFELYSPRAFPVRNEIAVLQIGSRTVLRSRYPNDGDTHFLIFFLTPQEFASISNGDIVTMRYGMDPIGGDRWEFGKLDKSRLDRR